MLLKIEKEDPIIQMDTVSVDIVPVTTGSGSEDQLADGQPELESPIHPLGIKPLGNKLLSSEATDARDAIGVFQALPDGMRKRTSFLVDHLT